MTDSRPTIRLVPEADLRAAVDEDAALRAVERAFRALAEGRARMPPPLGLHLPEVEGEIHVKGAHLEGAPVVAFKVASGFYRNGERGLPTGAGAFLVLDAETGFPLALLQDNGWLTDLRTAAAGALAARLLAPERPLRVGVLGAGVQARFQLRALARVREVAVARAWSPSGTSARALAQELAGELPFDVVPAGDPRAAVADADLVLTLTPSREPLLEAADLAPGVTVIAVGSDGPGKQELAAEVVAAADKVVCDRTEQCVRLGELQHPVARGLMDADDVHGELGDVLVGRVAGREADETVVCDLTGVGAQDAAIAGAAWEAVGRR